MQYIATLCWLWLFFGERVVAQAISKAANTPTLNGADLIYAPGLTHMIKQLEGDRPSSNNVGFRVVVVYEEPSNCAISRDASEKTNTAFYHLTSTSTVGVLADGKGNTGPEQEFHNVAGDRAKAYELVNSKKLSDRNAKHGGANSLEEKVSVGSKSEKGEYGKANVVDNTKENTRLNSNPNHLKSQKPGLQFGFSGEIVFDIGARVSQLNQKLGTPHTRTIFTDGSTTSMPHLSKAAPLSTKENPMVKLTTMNGPKTLKIDLQWSASIALGTAGDQIATALQTLVQNDATHEPRITLVTARPIESHILESGTIENTSRDASKADTSSFAWNQTSSSIQEGTSVKTMSLKSLTTNSTNETTLMPNSFVLKLKNKCIEENDLFQMISDSNPGLYFHEKPHEFKVLPGVSQEKPFQTNKFYSNLFLGSQTQTVFVHPYEVYWDKSDFHGMAVQYPNPLRRVFSEDGSNGAKRVYINGLFSPGLFIGATTFTKESNFMAVSDMKQMSVNVKFSTTSGNTKDYIEFPLVEGMGLVTSIYHGLLIPKIKGFVGFSELFEESFNGSTVLNSQRTIKYRAKVGNGETWLILVTVPLSEKDFDLKRDNNELVGSKAVDNLIIQVAIAPEASTEDEDVTSLEKIYYDIAGQYAIGAKVLGEMNCANVNYRFSYQTRGESLLGTTLIFALPHHFEILDGQTKAKYQGIKLPSATKGIMKGYLTDELVFSDQIDTNVNWLPYVKGMNAELTYTKDQIKLIRDAAVKELKNIDIVDTLKAIESQYFMGKALDKYAYLMYVLQDIVQDKELASGVLASLQNFFEVYKSGSFKPALIYDTKLKGVTSEAAAHLDFGSGFYNDHNFHYGYLIHAAALIGYVDSQNDGHWVADNKDFVNLLVRDVANPSENDPYFPVSRLFDWFHGHSWAKGIFESADGKDQESSSEDVHFSYAMKMWGRVTGDKSMEARGDLMLSIQARSFDLYYLYQDDNKIVPQEILNNKVPGILFENKVDYATYFGRNLEFIHGIQMLPMTAALGLVRNSVFAKQEWEQILKDVEVQNDFTGLLQANKVLFDPSSSWDFFSEPDFNFGLLNGGQSLAWALAFAAPFKNEVDGV